MINIIDKCKMRYVIFLLLGFLAVQVFCRPPIVDEAEDRYSDAGEDAEYETGGEAEGEAEAEDPMQEDSESRLGDQGAAEEDQQAPDQDQRLRAPNGNTYSQRPSEEHPGRANRDNFPGYNININSDSEDESVDDVNSNNEYQSTQQRETNRHAGKSDDQLEAVQRDDDTLKSLRSYKNNPFSKRTPISRTSSKEEGELLFESSPDQRAKAKNKYYNTENAEVRDQNKYSNKYYNSLQGISVEKMYANRLDLNRDRRAVQNINETSTQLASNNNVDTDNSLDDEEAAIKRHVEKLSGHELEELLNSLSEDKRDLLKKIMENDSGNDNEISKREITKKASAAPEECGNLESGLSEAGKLHEGNSGGDMNSQTPSTESTESSKESNQQSDINVLPATKTLESSNGSSLTSVSAESKADLIRDSDINQIKAENSANTMASLIDSNNQAIIGAIMQEPTKTDNKRETKSDDLSNIKSSFDDIKLAYNADLKDSQELPVPAYFCAQDENMSQFVDDESPRNTDSKNIKREAFYKNDADFSESIKSLEESFPNSRSYDNDDPYSGSDMAPLVRVKRKNRDLAVKKRSAGIMPDAKVAYFPYGAENDDEDNDEGNEFDDDGFYDRTSNLETPDTKENMPSEEESLIDLEDANQQSKSTNNKLETNIVSHSKLTQGNQKESDTISLGSDTDSVLSGVEGVDDNLMYNSGSRSRRTVQESSKINEQAADNTDLELNRPVRPTSFVEDVGTASENYVGSPNYHENDAFGPLPRSYEGELSRYKRIRRVKQLPASQDVDSSG